MQIPTRVTSINESAFYTYNQSTFQYETTIPDFIKNLTFAEGSKCSSIGNRAFQSCSSLTSASLSNSLFTIEYDAFLGCSSLTTIDFSNAINLCSIGSYAFAYCPKLVSLDLSKCTSLSSMEWYTFYGCGSLTSINLPNSIDKIPDEAFGNCSALISIDLSKCDKLSSVNVCAFESCTSLTSVSFPESLEKIEHSAFWGCSSLTSVDFSNCTSLSSISNNAFGSCSSITSISLPSSLSTLGMNVFSYCSNLSSITWDAWKGNTILPTEYLPFAGVCPDGGTVTVTNPIDDAHGSTALLEYLLNNGGLPESWRLGPELPESVYDINDENVLLGFKDEFLNDSSSPIYKDNFLDCNVMEIPSHVTTIASDAFYKNSESKIPSFITELTFAKNSNCSSIGSRAFQKCSSLTTIIFPNNLTSIDSVAFQYCSSLTSIDLSNTKLTLIDEMCFGHCTALTSIILSNNLERTEHDAFQYCTSLTSITLPSKLTSIGAGTFRGCSNLNYISWNLPNDYQTSVKIESFTFLNISSSGKVKSLNPSITSQQMLDWIKTNDGFPTGDGWTAES